MARDSINSTDASSGSLLLPTRTGIIIDLGTGDGTFVYRSAAKNPGQFYIGIDAAAEPLQKTSQKIYRKKAKGGLPNALFIQAAVETLPEDLAGIADEVHVHFPWGSLLRAVANGDLPVMRNIRTLCKGGAWFELITALDPERDKTEIERLNVRPLTYDFVEQNLRREYLAAGFNIVEHGEVPKTEWSNLCTSWAQRLASGKSRRLHYIIARATD